MADIDIIVSNGLYSIVLDKWDWTSLTVVDGGQTTAVTQTNGQWVYPQTKPGPIEFTATAATHTVQTVNPGSQLILAGTNRNHMCMLSFTPVGSDDFTLTAFCSDVSTAFKPTGTSPIPFSQVHMTGEFKKG